MGGEWSRQHTLRQQASSALVDFDSFKVNLKRPEK